MYICVSLTAKQFTMTTATAKQTILNSNGGGYKTLALDQFSSREVNKAIRELLDAGKIKITSPVTGYDLKSSTEYGVNQALSTKNFAITIC
jgi:hypothetical protein